MTDWQPVKFASATMVETSDTVAPTARLPLKCNFLLTFFTNFKLRTKQHELLLRIAVLVLIYILAFATRLFSVLRYESVIHEFDPYFNYRTTLYLTEKGFYEFWNWFDYESWHPLGRIVGGTLYPGLMVTAAFVYWTLRFFSIMVHIKDVCVLTAPFFASNTAMVAYLFGTELRDRSSGLVAAMLLAICPGYISRSVAGSYDNEAVAIFALLLTFDLFVKALNTGSLTWSLASAFGYFYMVSAWGGYIFIINLLPIYVVALLVSGRYSLRLYVAYNTVYVIGMLLAMQIRFVGYQHVQSAEHMAALTVFFLMQVFSFLEYLKERLSDPELFKVFLRVTVTLAATTGASALIVGLATGYISPWTGRFYSLLDPTYAKIHIPIIASVSEHQPTAWSSFMFDFHTLLILFPAGLYFCFKNVIDGTIFIIIYGMTSLYFAGIMVRLILVATPAVCLVSAIAVSALLKNYFVLLRKKAPVHTAIKIPVKRKVSTKTGADQPLLFQKEGSFLLLLGSLSLLINFGFHCTWVTSEAYSSPSIVLAARQFNGDRVVFDDFREAYFWLQHNTPQDAKVMSWWDYGYQITAMGNRTVIVDNNTWNNTHIATVGRAMASSEDDAYEIMRQLDVDYVLVVFGGFTGYSSDDINKYDVRTLLCEIYRYLQHSLMRDLQRTVFVMLSVNVRHRKYLKNDIIFIERSILSCCISRFLWMIRIGSGVFPVIQEADFLSNGDYRIDKNAAPKMLHCLMYKLCYYRFGEMHTDHNRLTGFDRARGVEIGNKDIKLNYVEEAFTTANWIVRIFKVKSPPNWT